MNIVLDAASSVTIRVAHPSGRDLALLSETLTVKWDPESGRLVVLSGRGGETAAEVYATDLSALSLGDDDLFDYRQRFDSHLRASVLDRIQQEGDCPLADHYGESGLADLSKDLNGEFAELMATPIDGWRLPEDITANGLFDVVLARVAAKTGQTWASVPVVDEPPELDLTTARLARIVEDHFELEERSVGPNTTWNEVGADSLDLIELTMAAEGEFDVEIDDGQAEDALTVGGMSALIDTLKREKARSVQAEAAQRGTAPEEA